MKDPSISDASKARREILMRRQEAEYLRFLRTKERPENFSTLKIIGKGAFGEVKLVQRKNDGKIYALKSLVKHEMVRLPGQGAFVSSKLTATRSKRTNWPTFARSVTFSPSPTVHGLSSCTRRSRMEPSFTCSWSFCLAVT